METLVFRHMFTLFSQLVLQFFCEEWCKYFWVEFFVFVFLSGWHRYISTLSSLIKKSKCFCSWAVFEQTFTIVLTLLAPEMFGWWWKCFTNPLTSSLYSMCNQLLSASLFNGCLLLFIFPNLIFPRTISAKLDWKTQFSSLYNLMFVSYKQLPV